MSEDDRASRLERRIDRFEEKTDVRLDRMAEQLAAIGKSLTELQANSSGMERLWTALNRLEARVTPLERDAPFVEIVRDLFKKFIVTVALAGLMIAAAMVWQARSVERAVNPPPEARAK